MKKIYFFISFFLLFFILFIKNTPAQITQHKVFSRSPEKLYASWLENKKLKFIRSTNQGASFTLPTTLYTFTEEVNAFDLKIEKEIFFYLVYETKNNEIFYLFSADGGKNFSSPTKLDSQAALPTLAVKDSLISMAWSKNAGKNRILRFLQSADGGISWDSPKTLQITEETLSSPAVIIDDFQQIHLVFQSSVTQRNFYRLYYTALDILNPKIIYESFQEIYDPQIVSTSWGLGIYFQKENLNQKEISLITSLDLGKTFIKAKTFPLTQDNFFGLIYLDNRWTIFTQSENQKFTFSSLKYDLPPTPDLTFPKDQISLNSKSPTLEFFSSSLEPLLYKIEISAENIFPFAKTWSLEYLNTSASEEIKFPLPLIFPEGTYFLRLSSFDGINFSSPSKIVEFKIDTTAPLITLLSSRESEIKNISEISIEGKVNETEVHLSFNGSPLSFEADGQFKTRFELNAGKNLLIFLATDEAGNTSLLSQEVSLVFEELQITLLKPQNTDWFKAGSTIFMEAEITDRKDELSEEAEAQIFIFGEKLESSLFYDKKERKLSGFVILPEKLTEGKHRATLKLNDQTIDFTLNLDNQSPTVTNAVSYNNSPANLKIPLSDSGAGIDLSSTLINFSGITFEGSITFESQGVMLKLKTPLADGSYEVEVTPRDTVGNRGQISILNLVVDTQAPILNLLTTLDAQVEKEKIMLEGKVEDLYPAKIKIYVNQKLQEDFTLSENYFKKEILLFPGSNDLFVEAYDAAGNITSQSLFTYALFKTANALVASYSAGPNPFNPQTQEIHLVYNLSQAADLKISIFDLAGTLLWEREIKNTSSGNTTWNGKDQFGRVVGNGIYPFLLAASSGQKKEIKRGKIVAFQ